MFNFLDNIACMAIDLSETSAPSQNAGGQNRRSSFLASRLERDLFFLLRNGVLPQGPDFSQFFRV